jgi:hypothetical protein
VRHGVQQNIDADRVGILREFKKVARVDALALPAVRDVGVVRGQNQNPRCAVDDRKQGERSSRH